ncbi:MAG TPA: acyl transferase [Verrucomicrobiae bacterium]|nr:acyl transferase [Verrucomicrobiae bacterium]
MRIEIPKAEDLIRKLFAIDGAEAFEGVTLEVYRFQYAYNALYRRYADLTGGDPRRVSAIRDIPFLPISFFKTQPIQTTDFTPSIIFESSGTTGSQVSRHLVKDPALYEASFTRTFEAFYGPATDYCFLALLPSYLERGSSSLVYMVKELIRQSGHPQSGFFLYDFTELAARLADLERSGQKTILIGVTYALLDFAAQHPMPLTNTIIMETGGMKGRKKELVRSEVHEALMRAFGVSSIHSEYGMTELLSQGYAQSGGRFYAPAWMKVLVREEDDPRSVVTRTEVPRTGAINIIDLANLYSCSFIATEDLGIIHPDGSFEVLGRIDNSDVRGCSLLAV